MHSKGLLIKFSIGTIMLSLFHLGGSCQSSPNKCLDSLLKRNVLCKLSGGEKVRIRSNHIINAAYAYKYWVPLNFKEIISHSQIYTDTVRYLSTDKKCSLKIWPGETIDFPLGQVDALGQSIGINCSDIARVEKIVNDHILFLKSGKEKELSGVKINEFCDGVFGYNFQMALKGNSAEFGYIYKTEISEIPVSGDLIFKHFLYKYDINYKEKYESIGLAMANEFSEF
ncbi:hypothetical protein ACXZ1K_04730 [Pedobacter sp. PWIIR3]